MIRFLYVVMVLALLALACESDDVDCNQDMVNHLDSCHNKTQWDSLDVVNKLMGQWSLDYYSRSADPGNFQYSTLYLDFNINDVLYIHTPSSQQTKYSWSLRSTSSGFVIDSDETGNIISGTILFCQERMELKDSPNGGCDQFFDKVE